ncbi:MAG TPA: methylamine dehydrogenase accessory protein MauD [Xanthomonadales bacterium]|nr:methylamine dehydrogenase accessory protein MauD [Xanthomonadales bacterium]
MINTLVISNIILWVLVLVLVAVVFALVRQIGVLYERVAPAGALMAGKGLKTGEQAPVFDLQTLAGHTLRIGGERSDGKSTLLFFLSPTCPVCKTLIPVLRAMRKSESGWLEIILASDGEENEHRDWLKLQELESWAYVLSSQLGMAMQVAKLPFAALIDENGVLCARGLVNSREHIESLFEAKKQGVASIQEYLKIHQQEQDVA